MTTATGDTPITEEERLLLYQNHIDQISELKASQWKVSHYALLGQAAIVASSNMTLPSLGLAAAYGGWLMAIVVFVLALVLIHGFQLTLKGRRDALDWLAAHPPGTFLVVLKGARIYREKPTSWPWRKRDGLVFVVFLVNQIIGVLLALLVIAGLAREEIGPAAYRWDVISEAGTEP